VENYVYKLSTELSSRLISAREKYKQTASTLSVHIHTGSKTVKRKGKELKLTGNTSKSRSFRFPKKISPESISKAVMSILEKEIDAGMLRAGITSLYIGASKLTECQTGSLGMDQWLSKIKPGKEKKAFRSVTKDENREKTKLSNRFERKTLELMSKPKVSTSKKVDFFRKCNKGTIPKGNTQNTINAISKSTSRGTTSLSWENIDLEILRGLPQNIQQEIEKTLPAGSKPSDFNRSPKVRKVTPNSWDEVDKSVLSSLPMELQKEIRMQYG